MPQREDEIDVTILGAGIVGICTALSLLERGVSVRLIDRGDPGQETSMGNAGVVSPWSIIPQSLPGTWKNIPKLLLGYGKPLSIHPRSLIHMVPWGLRFLSQGHEAKVRSTADAMSHLCAPSIELYQKHLKGTGHENLICESMYVHAFRDASRASLNDLEYQIRTEKGADLELVGQDQLAQIEPALGPDFKAAILVKGQARMRSPGQLGEILADKARKLGAQILKRELKAFSRMEDGWKIQCQAEEFHTRKLVVSLGAWSAEFLKSFSFKTPLMAERGYHVEFNDPGIEIYNSVMDVDAKFVASSMEAGVRIAGQAEFAPLDAPINAKRENELTILAKAAFPDLGTDRHTFWMGRRPSFPDSLPMLGPAPKENGLYLNFGHSHSGLMMAPKSGEIVAQAICMEHSNHDLEAYSPLRFT